MLMKLAKNPKDYDKLKKEREDGHKEIIKKIE